jgi:hypothetical protein
MNGVRGNVDNYYCKKDHEKKQNKEENQSSKALFCDEQAHSRRC